LIYFLRVYGLKLTTLENTETMSDFNVKEIELDKIVPHPQNLREFMGEDKASAPEVEGLKNSIYLRHMETKRGLINSITLMPGINQETGEPIEGVYYLVDGMQRLGCYKKLREEHPGKGFERIPATVNDAIKTEYDVMWTQLSANITQVKTKPSQTRMILLRLSEQAEAEGRIMSGKELGAMFGKTAGWVSQVLKLKNLTGLALEAFNNETLPATTAQTLAKLPPEHQDNFYTQWLESDKEEQASLGIHIDEFCKKLKEEGKAEMTEGPKFSPRPGKEILERFNSPQEGDDQRSWRDALEWVGRIDAETLLAKEAEKEARAAQKAAKKLAETEAKNKAAQEELEAIQAKIAAQKAQAQELGVEL
jgi:hypothetical protein